MKTDNLSDIRSRLWNSLEMAHVRLQLILWLGVYAAMLLIAGLGQNSERVFPTVAVVASLSFLPFAIFWLVRMWQIFRSPEEYVFCPTELGQPHHAPLGHGMFSFMGVIDTEEDGRFAVETHAIFQSAGTHLLMEDYLGKTVTLAWNRETDMVVVIG